MKGVPAGWGILLRTRSIHTAGLPGPIVVIGIDTSGRVRRAGTVAPGSIVFFGAVTWVAELPAGSPRPPAGLPLRAVPMVGRCLDP